MRWAEHNAEKYLAIAKKLSLFLTQNSSTVSTGLRHTKN